MLKFSNDQVLGCLIWFKLYFDVMIWFKLYLSLCLVMIKYLCVMISILWNIAIWFTWVLLTYHYCDYICSCYWSYYYMSIA